jgi:PilZ domain-containing protein
MRYGNPSEGLDAWSRPPTRTPKTRKRKGSLLLVWSKRSDRRAALRFPVALPVSYRAGSLDAQTGRTLDISKKGVRFTTTKQLAEGAIVELSVWWPALLHGTTPATLMLHGVVVRSGSGEAAATIKRAEFRPSSANLF